MAKAGTSGKLYFLILLHIFLLQISLPICDCDNTCVYPGVQSNGNALPFQGSFQIGEIITYICYANYELVGQVNLTCLGSDTWDADFPKCVKICPEITFPNTQIIDSNVTLDYANVIGDVLVWGCEDGYLLDPGQDDTQTVTRCKSLGWVTETDVITCSKISCPDPGIPIGLEREGNSFLFEDVVTFSCSNADDVISSGSTSRVCQSNGTWSGSNPTCTDVSCMDPGNNNYTTRTGDDTFKYEAVVTYECVEGAIKVSGSESINCQLDSTWSGEPLVCQYPETTQLPTDLVPKTSSIDDISTTALFSNIIMSTTEKESEVSALPKSVLYAAALGGSLVFVILIGSAICIFTSKPKRSKPNTHQKTDWVLTPGVDEEETEAIYDLPDQKPPYIEPLKPGQKPGRKPPYIEPLKTGPQGQVLTKNDSVRSEGSYLTPEEFVSIEYQNVPEVLTRF
ncbi:membrane cofactor protein-like [Antedon mediterranea]|uniref:membrane cofactor protein-like n=1 Tax=Antedon mediterranea TaxID=105859 RepID=UPI003AF6ABE7